MKQLKYNVQCTVSISMLKLVFLLHKREYCHENHDEDLKANRLEAETYDSVYAVAEEGLGKDERSTKFKAVKDRLDCKLHYQKMRQLKNMIQN